MFGFQENHKYRKCKVFFDQRLHHEDDGWDALISVHKRWTIRFSIRVLNLKSLSLIFWHGRQFKVDLWTLVSSRFEQKTANQMSFHKMAPRWCSSTIGWNKDTLNICIYLIMLIIKWSHISHFKISTRNYARDERGTRAVVGSKLTGRYYLIRAKILWKFEDDCWFRFWDILNIKFMQK